VPVNGLFYRTYTYRDSIGNGILQPSEVVVSSIFSYLGYSEPRDILSIQNGFDLIQHKLRINASFDYKGGYSLLNTTGDIQCSQSNSCPGASSLAASLAAQAANIAVKNGNPSTAVGFLDNGQFWRFRELAATWTLPDAFASKVLRAKSMTLTGSARNIHLWTKYGGPDPEASYGTGDVQTTYSTSGLRTYFILRTNLHY
jgi:hypothetical protein